MSIEVEPSGRCALQVTPAAPGPDTRLGRGYAPSLALGTAESLATVARLLRTCRSPPSCESHGHRAPHFIHFSLFSLMVWSEPGAGDVAGDQVLNTRRRGCLGKETVMEW